MATKKEETASFVLRFTQKIFEGETGEPQVQWRGNIRHVQGGEEKRFSEFEEVTQFIQSKLAELTIVAMENKTPEQQKGILSKSFELWKRMTSETPKMVIETIKDPMKGVVQLQTQISQVGDAINQRVENTLSQLPELDYLRRGNKEDFQLIVDKLDALSREVSEIKAQLGDKKIDTR